MALPWLWLLSQDTLILAGDDDPLVPLLNAHLMDMLIPNSRLHVFHAISRRYWLEGFWDQNLRAVAREVLFLGPPAAAVLWFRATRRGGAPRLREGRPRA